MELWIDLFTFLSSRTSWFTLDEDGNATPESHAEVTEWLKINELTESLQKIMAAEVVA